MLKYQNKLNHLSKSLLPISYNPLLLLNYSQFSTTSSETPPHSPSAPPFPQIPISKYSRVDDYQITGFLGKGSTSRVYQGYNILTKQNVILKLFKDIIPKDKILREIRVNQIIRQCQHVVPMIQVIRDQGCGGYGIVFQNLFGVPLTQLVANIEFNSGLKYIKNILQAIEYCHKRGVVHRDLKKSNILITKNGAKLFDFGLSYIQKINTFKTKRFGTKGYYAPQVLFKTPTFTHKIDIWTSGIIFTQILLNKKSLMPYKSDQQSARQIVHYGGYDQNIVNNSQLKYIKKINYSKLFQNCSNQKKINTIIAEIIERMMSINPRDRPEATEILQSQLFKNIV